MPRYKLTIEYDGMPYAGWQRQDGPHSVQAAIEEAFFKFTGDTIRMSAAGRTDAGVHASGQVAHVDLVKDWKIDTVRDALNAHLMGAAETVTILAVEQVDESFDARFSALKRHYLYKILNRRAPPAIDANRVWWVPKTLDHAAMHAAAQRLIGRHDFTTFRATQCQAKSPVRSLDRLDVTHEGERVFIHASAQSFLHNQIRSFAGSLVEVGIGRWNADDLEAALQAKDRTRCGPVAPPYGLYLMRVDY